jgi:hypothetical protein
MKRFNWDMLVPVLIFAAVLGLTLILFSIIEWLKIP